MFSAFSKVGLEILNKVGDVVAPLPDDEDFDYGQGQDATAVRGGEGTNGRSQATEDDEDELDALRRPSLASSDANLDVSSSSIADSELDTINLSRDSEDFGSTELGTFKQRSPPPKKAVDISSSQPIAFISNQELENRVQLKYRDSIENELTEYETKIKVLEKEKQRSAETIKSLSSKLQSWREISGGSPTRSPRSRSPLNTRVKTTGDSALSAGNVDQTVSQLSHELSVSREKLRKEAHANTTLQDTIRALESKYDISLADNATLQSRIDGKNDEIKSLKSLIESTQDSRNARAESERESEKRQIDRQEQEITTLKQKYKDECELTSMLSDRVQALETMVRKAGEDYEALQMSVAQKVHSSSNSAVEVEDLKATVERLKGETSARTVELENQVAERDREIDGLQQVVQLQTEEVNKLRTGVNVSGEVASKTDDGALQAKIEKLTADLQSAEAELQKSKEANQALEDMLHVAEECAWKARAEASELLYAYESEQEVTADLNSKEKENKDLIASLQDSERILKDQLISLEEKMKAVPDGAKVSPRANGSPESHCETVSRTYDTVLKAVAQLRARFENEKQGLRNYHDITEESQFSGIFTSEISLLSHYADALHDNQKLSSQLQSDIDEAKEEIEKYDNEVGILKHELVHVNATKAELASVRTACEGLRKEKDEYYSKWQSAVKELAQSIQAQSASTGSNADSSELQEDVSRLRKEVQRHETETRQLHQVISQLRNARRMTKDDVEGLIAERDKLRRRVEELDGEVNRLSIVASMNAGKNESPAHK